MPAASVASGWHALAPGLVSGGPTVATSHCQTLSFVLVSVTDLSRGGLVCPWVRDISATGKSTSLCMNLWPTALSCWLLGPSPAAAEWGQSLGYGSVASGFGWDFSCLSFVDVSVLSLVVHCWGGEFSYGLHVCGGFFVRCIQACTLFCSIYP